MRRMAPTATGACPPQARALTHAAENNARREQAYKPAERRQSRTSPGEGRAGAATLRPSAATPRPSAATPRPSAATPRPSASRSPASNNASLVAASPVPASPTDTGKLPAAAREGGARTSPAGLVRGAGAAAAAGLVRGAGAAATTRDRPASAVVRSAAAGRRVAGGAGGEEMREKTQDPERARAAATAACRYCQVIMSYVSLPGARSAYYC